ncbi:hypothetical protein [Larkinella rosea]|uniref:Outer membrane protein beta-barrel domain-containing protein n=1 Tax=Larkinella rosea TaxID=2025312 RepID=A0A3P1BCJ8_9BACT|nr:hypothetical protein [Larkinella rosea]RRA98595.1 hypothetical protein EHT25_26680 [Larkinella rosea]
MKTLYVLLLMWPVGVWAQQEPLKPIETTTYSVPQYTRYGYRQGYTSRYLYDGVEVRRSTELGKYILASGDPNAINEYRQFKTGRSIGTTLMVTGGIASIVGLIIAATPKETQNLNGVPPGLTYYNGAWYGNGMVYLGNPYANTETKKEPRKGGMVTFGVGFGAALIGTLIRTPGFHFRRSIQYYNKSLQTKDVSLRLEPHWESSNSGLGLVARF